MAKMMKVLNTRNNKVFQAEQVDANTYTVISLDGDQKPIKALTFDKWYKVITEEEYVTLSQKVPANAPENAQDAPPAPTPNVNDIPVLDPEADAKKAQEEAEAKAKAEEEKAQKEAEKKAQAEAKKAEAEAKKAEKDAEKAQKKEEAEALKAQKKAEAEAKKAELQAEKAKKLAEKESQGSMKDRHKEFFTKFLEALNIKKPGYSKAGARDRNYMSFPAGASGFKFKFVKTGDKMDCSLYIFGPQVVTSALFTELEKYKAEIESKLGEIKLDWSAPEDLKVRRVRTVLTGSDAELIEQGVNTLLRFEEVIPHYVDVITA